MVATQPPAAIWAACASETDPQAAQTQERPTAAKFAARAVEPVASAARVTFQS